MQKIQGPFRLYCRDRRVSHIDGRVIHHYEATTIPDLFRETHISLTWVGDRRFVQRYPDGWVGDRYYDYGSQDFEYLIRDCCGLIVPRWFIREELHRAGLSEFGRPSHNWPRVYWGRRWRYNIPRDAISGDWSVFRGKPLDYSGRSRWRSPYRNFRTFQEIREQERVCEELAEYQIKVRPRRKLPTLRDDVVRSNRSKNWKRHRKTQWKR